MNILYRGSFLREGLQQLGHKLLPLHASSGSLTAAAAATGCTIDLVLLEIHGASMLPIDIYAFEGRIAFYCIDSTINEFWLYDICTLADDVFVDQLPSVAHFAAHGIRAQWLPLCVEEGAFRKPVQPKTIDMAFVGTMSRTRIKRANMLTLLQRHVNVHVREGVSPAVMQDIFASAHIVLNENFFDGLTLRVFQGLASGSALLTEEGQGLEELFSPGDHLVSFTPATLLDWAEKMLTNPGYYTDMAAEGQRVCRQRHTSRIRAMEFLYALQSGTASNPRKDTQTRRKFEACGRCWRLVRYGSDSAQPVRDLRNTLAIQDEVDWKSAMLLADMEMRRGNTTEAEKLYTGICGQGQPFPFLRLALLRLRQQDTESAVELMIEAIRQLPPEGMRSCRQLLQELTKAHSMAAYLLVMGHIYRIMGQPLLPGFAKRDDDPCPDTAVEFACKAWALEPSAEAADIMLDCAIPAGVGGELLPLLLEGITQGILNDPQIIATAQLAYSYYAPDVAEALVDALRKSGRL